MLNQTDTLWRCHVQWSSDRVTLIPPVRHQTGRSLLFPTGLSQQLSDLFTVVKIDQPRPVHGFVTLDG